eukprot:227101-Amphidinium_carterae.1
MSMHSHCCENYLLVLLALLGCKFKSPSILYKNVAQPRELSHDPACTPRLHNEDPLHSVAQLRERFLGPA